jgi:8-oxo-dGTP diphosphatase
MFEYGLGGLGMSKPMVLGFMFDDEFKRVVLIRKNHPEWQAGRLNGVGGKAERGEPFIKAMVREFQEETGVLTEQSDWTQFALMHGEYFYLPVFYASSTLLLEQVQTITDEQVGIWSLFSFNLHAGACVSSLPWLLGLALDKNKSIMISEVWYND